MFNSNEYPMPDGVVTTPKGILALYSPVMTLTSPTKPPPDNSVGVDVRGADNYSGALYYNYETNDFILVQGQYFYHVTTAGVLNELGDITSLG
ncbi:MAG: hypothetical protein MK105_08475 [Crocinitomicaceae bacterium]|nr:hypothetical protein [Crocinitomicaceae bacterium]